MRLLKNRLLFTMCCLVISGFSTESMASAFQLFEQDGASVGNYHAGYAAEANDASIAFYNPAGMTRIRNQQIVLAGLGVLTDFQYKGTVAVNNLATNGVYDVPIPVTAQGGLFSFIPNLFYVTPLSERFSFGLSVVVPFGLRANYGRSTDLRYASTFASVKVVDVSPTLAYQMTDKASFGIGPDLQRMSVEFDQYAVLDDPSNYATSVNRADDTGYGAHFGWLYQFTQDSRLGISYHSQVVHHLSRRSTFSGPLADLLNENGGPVVTRASADITLPAYTALSLYHRFNPKVALMGSAIYTQWSTVRSLVMKNVAGIIIQNGIPVTVIPEVVIPQNFHNTWNFSIGADYFVNDKLTLKSGIGYDQTPVKNKFRNVMLPDNDRYVLAFGGHYQISKAVGIDLGWMHLFIDQAKVSPPPQVTGSQITTTNGNVTGGADVYSTQVTWDII